LSRRFDSSAAYPRLNFDVENRAEKPIENLLEKCIVRGCA